MQTGSAGLLGRAGFNNILLMKTLLHENIYKIVTGPLWTRAQNENHVPGMPIDEADGYMHFSTKDQLLETLRLYFSGQSGLEILVVNTKDVAKDLKWEVSRGGALFPHLHAPLRRELVHRHATIAVDDNGNCQLPEGLL
ncbi:FIG005495: hypothetical protein [hydrothermal vent metagenome]|uniref:DUF952 domain-containing protein n=1 Tax=hydrothermal vent metagenome TaxID=652676 RepID=A0A3B0TWP2_9ZZZZ